MKKTVIVLLLSLLLSAGAFADHPSGWGIGIVGQYNLAWDGFDGSPGLSLSLKAPQMPIYWGINVDLGKHLVGFNITGDYLIIDQPLVREVNLGWYLGLGGYVGFYKYSFETTDWVSLRAGARLPIGIYIVPVKFFEVFVDVAPSLGMGMYFGDYDDSFNFPEGGLGLDLGLRFWF